MSTTVSTPTPTPTPTPPGAPLPASALCCLTNTARAVQNDVDWEEMHRMILQLDLPITDKNLVLVRFRRIFGHIDGHYRAVQRYYNASRTFVITASILNPALLSIASTEPEKVLNTVLFWVVWCLQLLVSLVTAYIAFFKWDKKYFVYLVHKQRVEQEIWTYLELTGKYSIVNPMLDDEVAEMRTTHRTKVKLLLSQLELIYRKLQDADVNIQHMDGEQEGRGDSARTTRRGFGEEVHRRQQRRLEATERKLETLAAQLERESDPSLRRSLTQDLERYQQVRQKNKLLDQQVMELEQHFDNEGNR